MEEAWTQGDGQESNALTVGTKKHTILHFYLLNFWSVCVLDQNTEACFH